MRLKKGLEQLPKKYVIVGANSAGVSATIAARKIDAEAEITLISDEKHLPYSRCGLPYVLSGEIPNFKDLILFPPSYYKMMGVDLRMEITAESIDPNEKSVRIENATGKQETIGYDSLLLATGATQFIPPIKGINKRGVLTLCRIEEGEDIMKAMRKTKTAFVVGAGYIGLELAHALSKKNIRTTIIERQSQILPMMLDREMSDIVQKRIEKRGVKVIVGKAVDEIIGDDRATGIGVAGEEFEADLILMATGVRPNVELARKVGIELGLTGAIRVNPRMETSIPNIYAAGDCVESSNMITGQPTLSQLGTTAERQGKAAGINLTGGYSIFPGILDSTVSMLFGLEVGSTGFTESYAQQVGFKTISGTITSKTRAEYYPGGKGITAKIVAEPDMGRIIGGQIVGGEEVTQRVNMISIAIQNQICVSELSKADTCYAPNVCSPWEPVVLAADIAAKKIAHARSRY